MLVCVEQLIKPLIFWKLEKKLHSTVASSAVRPRRDGVTLTFDLSTQKRNQVIRCTSDKSLAKIYQ